MGLNVISNYAASIAHRNLERTNIEASQSLAELSSGTRVVSAKDDPAPNGATNPATTTTVGAPTQAGQAPSLIPPPIPPLPPTERRAVPTQPFRRPEGLPNPSDIIRVSRPTEPARPATDNVRTPTTAPPNAPPGTAPPAPPPMASPAALPQQPQAPFAANGQPTPPPVQPSPEMQAVVQVLTRAPGPETADLIRASQPVTTEQQAANGDAGIAAEDPNADPPDLRLNLIAAPLDRNGGGYHNDRRHDADTGETDALIAEADLSVLGFFQAGDMPGCLRPERCHPPR